MDRAFIQWQRLPEKGPIPPRPDMAYTDNAEDVIRFVGPEFLLGDYNSRIGDNALMFRTRPSYSPSGTGYVTMHPGDFATFGNDDCYPIIVPGYLVPGLFPEWVE